MKRQLKECVNLEIMNREMEATDWHLNNLVCELYWWADFLNIAFLKDQPVPVPLLSFERTRINNLGHYVIGRNAFGFKENININRANLNRPLWDLISILLHEICHGWQHRYGNPSSSWFHNREFQMKMLEFGIVIDSKGRHLELGDPFVFLLRKHGITFNLNIDRGGMIKVAPWPTRKGKSKLKKWTCGCTNIRVAISDLEAKCLKCGNRFQLAD